MEQAHCPEWVVAGVGFQNNPVRNLVEPVFPIELGDVGVIQRGFGNAIRGAFDAGFLQLVAPLCQGGGSEQYRCDSEGGWQKIRYFDLLSHWLNGLKT